MRAIRQTQFGGPEVLRLVEVDAPAGLGADIVVAVRAIGLNPIELFIRSGQFPLYGQPPFILGSDISGVVTATNAVNRLAVGDEVFGFPLFPRVTSGYAEVVAAPSRHFVRKPANWTHEQAAAVVMPGLTAWQGLVEGADIGPGDRVLIHAAAGGVGHVAVQIAKARGAYVIATASAAKTEFVRGLGADQVIDYAVTSFEDEAGQVDVVFESLGGENGTRSLALLGRDGRYVTIIDHRKPERKAQVEAAGVRFVPTSVEPDHTHLEALADLGRKGQLTPHVSATFPLAEAARAHEALAKAPVGKLVLTV